MRITRTVIGALASLSLACGGANPPTPPRSEAQLAAEATQSAQTSAAAVEVEQLDADLTEIVRLFGEPELGQRFAVGMCSSRGQRWRQLDREPRAQYLWGICMLLGLSGDGQRAPEAAHILFMRAAAEGLPAAETQVGSDFEHGVGVPVDYAAAREWYERAASHDDALAHYNLGRLHNPPVAGQQQCIGVPCDERKAYAYFNEAADRGLAAGVAAVARKIVEGRVVEPNILLACDMFSLAARAGDTVATEALKDCAEWSRAEAERLRSLRPETRDRVPSLPPFALDLEEQRRIYEDMRKRASQESERERQRELYRQQEAER